MWSHRLGYYSCSCEMHVFARDSVMTDCSQHTSAALTINENYDPGAKRLCDKKRGTLRELQMCAKVGWHWNSKWGDDSVRCAVDMTMALDKMIPESWNWKHVDEGAE